MLRVISLFFLFLGFSMLGQDTLYKRDGGIVISKIKEITATEIKYQRIDMIDGPIIIVSKNAVHKIKYANGSLDSFLVVKQEPLTIIKKAEPLYINLRNNNGGYKYDGHRRNEQEVLFMANQKNKIWNNPEITSHTQLSKKNKLKQFAFGFGGLALAVGVLAGTGTYIGSQEDMNGDGLLLGAAAVSGSILIPSLIFSKRSKRKRIDHTNKVVELYNQLVKAS